MRVCDVRVCVEGEERWDTRLPTDDLPRYVCLHGNTALCHTDDGCVMVQSFYDTHCFRQAITLVSLVQL